MAAAAAESIVQLAHKYRDEFERHVNAEALRARTAQLSAHVNGLHERAMQHKADLQAKSEELSTAAKDMTPVEGLNSQRAMETFAWCVVLCGAYSVASAISALMLAPLVFGAFDTLAVVALAFCVLPALALMHVRGSRGGGDGADAGDDMHARWKLLAFAAAEGLLVGALLHNSHFATLGPAHMITPLAIALVAQLAANTYGSSRQTLLGLAMGASVAAHVAVGLVTGQLGAGYMVLMCAYTAIGFVTLQCYLHNLTQQDEPVHIYQLAYLCAHILCHALVHMMLGAGAEVHAEVEALKPAVMTN